MNGGDFLRIAEAGTAVLCGAFLAKGNAGMRWEHRGAKILYMIFLMSAIVFRGGNAQYARYSAKEYGIVGIYIFLITLLYFRIYFWEAFARFYAYWLNLQILHYFVIYLCCIEMKNSVSSYVNYKIFPWHPLNIGEMICSILMAVFLCIWKRREGRKGLSGHTQYVWMSVLLILEFIVSKSVMNDNSAIERADLDSGILMVLVLFLIISAGLIFAIVNAYFYTKQQERMVQKNLNMVQKQYDIVQGLYEQRRKQFHDMNQQNILLYGYLEEGKIERAKKYLHELIGNTQKMQKNRYTGIQEIDFLLDYKMTEVSKDKIRFIFDFDILFCPCEKSEMCILLGNLLDNAIEAVRGLDEEKRQIEWMMKTVNKIFILSMKNPYKGKRKKTDGQYQTTKQEKEMHGLGLQSVQMIVEKYDGHFEIQDDGSTFEVNVSIFS